MPDPDHIPDLDVTVPVAAPTPAPGAREAPDLPLPEELARLLPGENYTVEGFLGQGGMGAVYRGTQVRLQRKVAIKIMRRDMAKDQGFEERFRREALAMAQLNHPNIVNVIDYGEAGPEYLYIVMELIDGTDLVGVIRSGQMTQETALKLLPQICDALQFAHDNGIVHRDIKPANILLTRDGRIKMADFGLAKRFDAENSYRTQSGYGLGTPDYAAPEQFDPHGSIDHRADIYALGVMIYQMVTGTLPRGAWKPPSEKAAVDAHWDQIVSRALQTDPHERYASVSEIKSALSTITPMPGGPHLAPDGTQGRKTTGMTAVKGSTTALTQAGGRSATKACPPSDQTGAPSSRSSRSRMPLFIAAAVIVLAVGGWFGWEKFKPETLPSASQADAGQPSYPKPQTWVDVTSQFQRQALASATGKVEDGLVHINKESTHFIEKDKVFDDVALRVVFRGRLTANVRIAPPVSYAASVEPTTGDCKAGLFQFDQNLRRSTGFGSRNTLFGPEFDPQQDHELVISVVGDRLTYWMDGRLILSAQDAAITKGGLALGFYQFQENPASAPKIRKVEYAELDGTAGVPVASFATSRTWQAPTPTVTADTEWTNLIPHIQPQRDVIRGSWTVDEKGLTAKRAEWAFCNIPVQDPGTDYDLRYKVTRGEGLHLAMFFAFRKGSTGGYVPIDYINANHAEFADGQRWTMVEDIKDQAARDPAALKAKRKEWLLRGKACTVLLQVREKEVIVSVDDQEALRWPANWSKLQQRGGEAGPLFMDVTGDPIFGVGIFNCEAVFHSIEMRKSEPAGTKSTPSPAITIGTEWTDLVPHIQPERDAVRGDWKPGKDGLASVNLVRWSLCKFPVQQPVGDYEIRYRLTRTGGPVDGLFFPFRWGNAAGSVAVDYPGLVSLDGMRRVALQKVEGRTLEKPSDIVAMRKEWIPFGKTCTVLLQVGAKEVRVLVDDVEAIRWQADWSQIQQSASGYPWASVFSGLNAPIFGIGMFNSDVVYHSIEMRLVGEN
jgi:serine/threonine protein kinase